MEVLIHGLQTNQVNQVNQQLMNDLEIPASRVDSRLLSFKQHLQLLGYHNVAMTGSGSTFFVLNPTHKKRLPKDSFHVLTRIK